jgi:hypothetical protein
MKIMATGQTIYLTAHEDKMLRRVYLYLAGYAQRNAYIKKIELKREEVLQYSGGVVSSGKDIDNSAMSLKSYRQEQRTAGEIQTGKQLINLDKM